MSPEFRSPNQSRTVTLTEQMGAQLRSRLVQQVNSNIHVCEEHEGLYQLLRIGLRYHPEDPDNPDILIPVPRGYEFSTKLDDLDLRILDIIDPKREIEPRLYTGRIQIDSDEPYELASTLRPYRGNLIPAIFTDYVLPRSTTNIVIRNVDIFEPNHKPYRPIGALWIAEMKPKNDYQEIKLMQHSLC